MLFTFFGRIIRRTAASAPSRSQVRQDSTGSGPRDLTTISDALPEVNEGSGDDDWAAWDAAMAAMAMLESRRQALHAVDVAHLRAEMTMARKASNTR